MGYPAWVLSTPYPGMAATSTPNAPTTTLVALSDTAIPAKPTPLPPEVFCRKDAPGDYIYPPIDLTKLHWETSLVVGRTAQRLDGLTAPPYMGSHSPDGLDIIQIASSNP